ncbi:potassium channel family protein [Ornithinimicrobium avium]|uniref:Two pore domain potassium channel family protein n=1 Tax=Ornithinimicrobium avium TaxID=2283195 RepID=A0A345NMY0_9MICO|nr:potassium channel family protein [Ornithinimicrobium avium]AXH96388.1 two pore domain potassium channel family protein [Ornithinimicrobium avium]
MSVVLTLAGVLLVLVGLQDMFHTLLHPTGQGRLTGLVLAALWKLSRATRHRLVVVGPSGMLLVLLLWVILQVCGWALIYLPHVPRGFTYSSGLDPGRYVDAVESLYVSAVTLTTLGYGDVVATQPWVRAVSPLEALTGFALLTAGLTWFTQIYPPLSRRRALALELKGLADAGYADSLQDTDPAVATRVLDTLAAQVGTVRIDFAQHGEGFYFQESDPDLSLAHHASYLVRLTSSALACPDRCVHRSGLRLSSSVEQLSATLDANFLHVGAGPQQVFDAYAVEHGHGQ